LNGVWRLRLGNGAYTLNFTGKTLKNVIISGVYTAKDGRITFRDHSAACSEKSRSGGCQIFGCHQRATYTFTLTRTTLTFARLRDHNADCELPVVLPSPFHRVR
jgi:hypothetical protein